MPPKPASLKHPPFEIVPGRAIGPFRLGMTVAEVEALCREYGLENLGVMVGGFGVDFRDGRAVEIAFEATHPLSLGGAEIASAQDEHVRRLVERVAPGAEDWTNIAGLRVLHYELADGFVFAFLVFGPATR
ncbi:MAG: hypothetical protein U1F37_08010 [Alphaproteobacteria bacterium]